jgi:membrane associated rhomboid family serine protease
MNDNHFKFSASVITIPFVSVLFLWIVFWIDIRFHLNFDQFGIYPRTLPGLIGVICSPFLHENFEHLYNNSIPLLILIAALRYFYREYTFKILGYGILLSGIITWIIGRDSYHIGASGLIYVLVSFIFFKGIMTKYYRLVALSLLVILVYGSMIWYIFPNIKEDISWEGHLAGLISGFVFALHYKTPEYKKLIKYDWEHPDFNPNEDKFMQRFDENGNFVNLPKEEVSIEEENNVSFFHTSNPNINYEFIENKNKSELKPGL